MALATLCSSSYSTARRGRQFSIGQLVEGGYWTFVAWFCDQRHSSPNKSHSIELCGEGHPRSAKAARGEDLQIEHPTCGGYAPAFHFHSTLARVPSPTLIRDQVVQVRQPCEKRLLAATGVVVTVDRRIA